MILTLQWKMSEMSRFSHRNGRASIRRRIGSQLAPRHKAQVCLMARTYFPFRLVAKTEGTLHAVGKLYFAKNPSSYTEHEA